MSSIVPNHEINLNNTLKKKLLDLESSDRRPNRNGFIHKYRPVLITCYYERLRIYLILFTQNDSCHRKF